LISDYLDRLLEILAPHFEGRKYLFGARPAFADFGLGLQVYEMALDPTAGAIIRRMCWPGRTA
jgi:glutathione S-transferase